MILNIRSTLSDLVVSRQRADIFLPYLCDFLYMFFLSSNFFRFLLSFRFAADSKIFYFVCRLDICKITQFFSLLKLSVYHWGAYHQQICRRLFKITNCVIITLLIYTYLKIIKIFRIYINSRYEFVCICSISTRTHITMVSWWRIISDFFYFCMHSNWNTCCCWLSLLLRHPSMPTSQYSGQRKVFLLIDNHVRISQQSMNV